LVEQPVAFTPIGIESGDRSEPVESAGDREAAAYAAGYNAGLSEGRIHAVGELEPLRALLRALIGSLERDQLAARRGAAENIQALALAVARWMFQRAVEQDVNVTESLIRRAVNLLPAGTPIEIRANPIDLAALGDHLDLREPDGRGFVVHWVSEPTMERGSFTVATPERLVDCRADVALRSLYERLVGS
jgi:flagellar biosynthesis/type III secretory pathway protein FliH